MLAKIFLVVCLATLVVSHTKEEDNELVSTALGTGTNLLKEFSKLVSDDAEKYSLDLNSIYKKYEVASKANQAKNFVQAQFKRGAELTNEYLKKADVESEDQLKKSIEIFKKEDPVLYEKLNKFYEKSCDIDRISEDIVKYLLDADRVGSTIEKVKSTLQPLEHKLAESIKKFEGFILENLPKKGKKNY